MERAWPLKVAPGVYLSVHVSKHVYREGSRTAFSKSMTVYRYDLIGGGETVTSLPLGWAGSAPLDSVNPEYKRGAELWGL